MNDTAPTDTPIKRQLLDDLASYAGIDSKSDGLDLNGAKLSPGETTDYWKTLKNIMGSRVAEFGYGTAIGAGLGKFNQLTGDRIPGLPDNVQEGAMYGALFTIIGLALSSTPMVEGLFNPKNSTRAQNEAGWAKLQNPGGHG